MDNKIQLNELLLLGEVTLNLLTLVEAIRKSGLKNSAFFVRDITKLANAFLVSPTRGFTLIKRGFNNPVKLLQYFNLLKDAYSLISQLYNVLQLHVLDRAPGILLLLGLLLCIYRVKRFLY